MTGRPHMDGWRVLETAVDMARRGEAFALATVVWREGPSSGKQGSRAIVTPTGEIHGWIGGACAEPVLIREAQRALEQGAPVVLSLGETEPVGEERAGVTRIAISCQSEGALQIFIEPVIPAPHLVVVGRSPMAHTLHTLAGDLDWNTELIDGPDFDTDTVSPDSIVIVATQGHGDEDVLEAAVAAHPAYLGVVGSVRRGEALKGYLTDRGVDREVVDAIRVPVGLDLGRTSHREMAVAVLAELVQLRASGELPGGVPPVERGGAVVAEATDPICGMIVTADESSFPFEHDGETHYFCCAGCRSRFERELEEVHGADLNGGA